MEGEVEDYASRMLASLAEIEIRVRAGLVMKTAIYDTFIALIFTIRTIHTSRQDIRMSETYHHIRIYFYLLSVLMSMPFLISKCCIKIIGERERD